MEPPERDAEGNKLTKKARTALLKAAEKERSARRASAAERMDPEASPSLDREYPDGGHLHIGALRACVPA